MGTVPSRWTLALAALVALVAFATSAQEARKYAFSATVTVLAVDPAGPSLRVAGTEGEERTLRVDPQARLLEGSATLRLEQLRAGDRVAIDAHPASLAPDAGLVVHRLARVQAAAP